VQDFVHQQYLSIFQHCVLLSWLAQESMASAILSLLAEDYRALVFGKLSKNVGKNLECKNGGFET